MPSDRTVVTELATGLGMLGEGDLATVIKNRPGALSSLTTADWDQLTALWDSRAYELEFASGFLNGRAFLHAPDALNGRRPRLIEWTGGRRPPGDDVLPSDLRIDHVYLVSCKYLSRILHNPSPARLVEGLLTQAPVEDVRDWYLRTAPFEYQRLYEACARAVSGLPLPERAADLTTSDRRRLVAALQGGWPNQAGDIYRELCRVVSDASAAEWNARVNARNAEVMLWRLLRFGSAPYFILGASPQGAMRLRIATPWDWRQEFRLVHFEIKPQAGGQPRVGWTAVCEARKSGAERIVRGHIEIRWSHGRFGQPPEAKVYLDSPHDDVPGYHPL